ncbi:unnamed protein product [Brassica oleracea]
MRFRFQFRFGHHLSHPPSLVTTSTTIPSHICLRWCLHRSRDHYRHVHPLLRAGLLYKLHGY